MLLMYNMLISKTTIRKHKKNLAIILFIILFFTLNSLKPSVFYNEDGSLKEFGTGYRHKTIFPLWLFAIALSIVAYLAVSYLLLK
jgi:hypothetical protein